MTRTRRVAASVALSLMSQVLAMVIGLWLTRFILDQIGQHTYGVWLIVLQALGWLTLADLGVVALLPRETAFLTGRDAAPDALPKLVGEATRLMLWQWPVVALLCGGAWLLVPVSPQHREVLGLTLLVFAAGFPLRLFTALLQGLQDLVFLGWLQFAAWLLSTAVAVVALLAGMGLFALVLSWSVAQLVPPLVAWRRLTRRFPRARPRVRPVTRAAARAYLGRSLWISLSQLAGILVTGADVLIIGLIMGPAAVVPYVVTLKIIAVIGNFPVAMAHASGPALSQMRAGESREDLRRATTALSMAVLAASGAVACVVLAVNEGFVGWWVGADRYAGSALTVLGVALMLTRHYGTTVAYAVYSLGHERRLALTGVVEGVVSVGATVALVKMLGPVGAVLGGLIAALLFVLPLTLPTLAAETATSVGWLLRALLPFAARLAVALAVALAAGALLGPAGPARTALVALAAAAVYAALLAPVAMRPPLREYVLQLARAIRGRLERAAAPGPPPVPPAATPS
jgi:O-antigen/teichoic acid export membrane protein